jgi:hypothetical protein
MKSIEEVLFDRSSSGLLGAASPFPRRNRCSSLTKDLRQTANRGFLLFPVSELARQTGHADLLISEATNDILRLEELAAEYPLCSWRTAIGPSDLCVIRVDGPCGRASFEVLCLDQGDCLTLWAQSEGIALAFFRKPTGLVLRLSAKKLAPGVKFLADGDSCPIPPSRGWGWSNPWAEIEAVPGWLRELAFEAPECPPGKAACVPRPFPRIAPCRSAPWREKPHREVHKGDPTHDEAGWPRGFRISRRR